MTYGSTSRPRNRPPAHRPKVTAGLKCPPEIGPSAYAPVNTVSPNASDTPANPIPNSGNAPASTALPHPPRTSQKVPRNSLVSLEGIEISSESQTPGETARVSRACAAHHLADFVR